MQSSAWIHIPAAALTVKGVKHAMAMPVPRFLAKAQKTRETCCPPMYGFSEFPLGVSFHQNTLRLPSFNWCFYDLYVFGEGKWKYPIPLLFIVRKSSSTKCQKIQLKHICCWPTPLMWQEHKWTASLLALASNTGWPVSLPLLICSVLA